MALSPVAHPVSLVNWASPSFPAGASSVRGDWSSDFGIDYVARSTGVNDKDPLRSGFASTTPSPWPVATDFHAEIEISRPALFGLDGSSVHALGSVDIGAAGPLVPTTVHRYHLDFDLANPAGCCGLSTAGTIDGRFSFDETAHIFWVAEWVVEVAHQGTADILQLDAALFDGTIQLLPNSRPENGIYRGSVSGNGIAHFARFDMTGGIFGRQMLGPAHLSMDLSIAFSSSPFTEIPRDPPDGVPEPGTLGLLAIALAGCALAVRGRRDRRGRA